MPIFFGSLLTVLLAGSLSAPPSNRKAKDESDGPTQGRRRFTPPADGDWVLVVEDASLDNSRPTARE